MKQSSMFEPDKSSTYTHVFADSLRRLDKVNVQVLWSKEHDAWLVWSEEDPFNVLILHAERKK